MVQIHLNKLILLFQVVNNLAFFVKVKEKYGHLKIKVEFQKIARHAKVQKL
jgi:hypothetical protein